jgi:uncharacterized protein YndB with AHSA1/START domain
MTRFLLSLAGGIALVCIGASAGVTEVASNGFTLKQDVVIAAGPDKVYAMLVEPARWWNSEHTWSGSASNLTLEARAGGCFCETLAKGGSVQHLAIVSAQPGKLLRLTGLLGPFQSMAGNGVMTWTLTTDPAGTHLELTYQIAGYANMAMGGKGYEFWSKAADGMLADQVTRLKRAAENAK